MIFSNEISFLSYETACNANAEFQYEVSFDGSTMSA